MTRSFRLRLALLTSAIAGLAVGAFGGGAWWLIRDLRLERIDDTVREHAEREVGRTRDLDQWRTIEARIGASLGAGNDRTVVLLVQTDRGDDVYRSARWPAGLELSRLEWPAPEGPGVRQPKDAPPVSAHAVAGANGRQWRLGLARTDRARVAVAADQAGVDAEMTGVRNAFLLALGPVLALVGLGSWATAASAMRPIRALADTSRAVTARGLDQRIEISGADREFAELIALYNGMLERLERSFRQAHRFAADAAHELKTPLAILQGQLERAIQAAEPGSDAQIALTRILDEVRRLSTISEKLLLLARADAGKMPIQRGRFELSLALDEVVDDARMLAPHLRVDGAIEPGIEIEADDALIWQVLQNLLSNAIKFNVADGWIRISLAASPTGARVWISNASTGIPLAERGRVFERFYRADPARSRMIEGVGLGLSVSREIARAHGGDLLLDADKPGEVTFVLSIPGTTTRDTGGRLLSSPESTRAMRPTS